jgi:DNA-binding NarL/FixJ family response regulator
MAKQMPKSKEASRIFIVDDHPVFRDGLAGVIRQAAGLTVCGEADNAQAALAAIERLKPELVLLDLSLPGRGGLELIKDLRAVRPESAVLVISMHDEALYAERVLRAGGQGYIMKQEGPEKMLEAIRLVLAGQIYLSSKMSSRILGVLSGRRPESASAINQLTDRQLEILQLTGEGRDSHAIAKMLHLSFKTVDAHRAQIRERLGLKNYTELISYAARWVEAQPSPDGKKRAFSGKARETSAYLV